MGLRRFCIALLLLTACSSGPESPPNTLVVGLESGPSVLDPRYAVDAVSANICRLIYSGLMVRGKSLELLPSLAESVEQKDAVTYLIHIRQGLKFHNGNNLTASDVRFTINSVLDSRGTSPLKGSLGEVRYVQEEGPYTVKVVLERPFAPFVAGLTFGIVPEGSGDLSGAPIGAGPFRFASYEKGSSLLLARNESYFAGKPGLAGVRFRIIPDETTRLLELKKGNINLITSPIAPATIPWLERQKSIHVDKELGTNVSYLGFNLRDPCLSDIRIRRAIAHAIDRDAIGRHLLKGTAVPTQTLLSSANPFHAANLPVHDYDPQKAKQLLLESHCSGTAHGPLSLVFKTSKNPTRSKIAEIIAEELREVGISVVIRNYEWGTFFSDIQAGNFQVYSLTWVGIADPDILRFIFHTNSIPPRGANRGGYSNPLLDKLLDAGRGTETLEERQTIYRQAQGILNDDLPYLTLWTSVNVAAVDRRVKGFALYPDEGLDSLASVTLDEGNGK